MTKEVGPEGGVSGDGERYESHRSTQTAEGEDDMAKRSKRKDRSDERSGGTVIPLHGARGDSMNANDVASSQVVPTVSAGGSGAGSAASGNATAGNVTAGNGADEARSEPLAHEDDHPDVQHFFSAAERASAPAEPWTDLDTGEHEPDAIRSGRRKGMVWTGAIAGGGLLLISAFLIYNKLLMPAPEELGGGPVTLPTPDMMQGARSAEPEPAPPPPVVEEPVAQAAPAAPPTAEPSAPTPPPAPTNAPATTPNVVEQPAAPAAAPAPQGAYEAQLAEARKLGLRKNAEQAYLKAVEFKPDGAEALSGLAMLYLNQGKNQQARERAQQALARDPKSTESWIVLGAAEDALGNRTGARDAYAKCAALPADKYVLECRRMLH